MLPADARAWPPAIALKAGFRPKTRPATKPRATALRVSGPALPCRRICCMVASFPDLESKAVKPGERTLHFGVRRDRAHPGDEAVDLCDAQRHSHAGDGLAVSGWRRSQNRGTDGDDRGLCRQRELAAVAVPGRRVSLLRSHACACLMPQWPSPQ